MKINALKNTLIFRSGYPTFNSGGHLSYKPVDIYDHIYIPFKQLGVIKSGPVLNYLA